MIKQLIHSAKIKKEIMLKVGLRTVDSHEVEVVDALLDSGATGLFINHAWLCQNKITTCLPTQCHLSQSENPWL